MVPISRKYTVVPETGRIGVLNILWLIGLVAACEVVRLLNSTRRRQTVSWVGQDSGSPDG